MPKRRGRPKPPPRADSVEFIGNTKNKKRETEVSQRLINFVLLMYKQLTLAQRYTISSMRQNGSSLQSIADELNRLREEEAALKGEAAPTKKIAASTISRELNRNRNKRGGYSPGLANDMAMERRERIVRNSALKPGVLERAMKLLVEKRWSPEQISGHLKLKGVKISIERIYQEIRANIDKYRKYTHHGMKYRRHQSRPYKTAGKSMIPDRVSIHDRPAEADGTRFEDWEMDLVIGAEQKSSVLTVIERSLNIFMQTKLPSKQPSVVEKSVIRLLLPYRQHVHTITTDNGIEFMNHKNICKALDCTVYFADPYCSGQKGAIENMNKILREFFPKGTDFRLVSQTQLDKVQYQINERPRKKLGFSTPKVEFFRRIT